MSDRGQFISETRLLLSSDEVQNLLMATTVDDALRLIQREGCYCALVDNALASGTGIQAVTRLRHELGWPELTIPVILITGRTTMDTIRSAVLAGVDEVLSTPLASETLAGRMLDTRLRPRTSSRPLDMTDPADDVGPGKHWSRPNSGVQTT